jgi:hypothetical protein
MACLSNCGFILYKPRQCPPNSFYQGSDDRPGIRLSVASQHVLSLCGCTCSSRLRYNQNLGIFMDLDHLTQIRSHKGRHRVILDSRSLRNAARLQALQLPMKVLLA